MLSLEGMDLARANMVYERLRKFLSYHMPVLTETVTGRFIHSFESLLDPGSRLSQLAPDLSTLDVCIRISCMGKILTMRTASLRSCKLSRSY
jgi:hypothetical protein